MPSVTLHTNSSASKFNPDSATNGLPALLQTPSGLAILEIQGTIHAPFPRADTNHLALGGGVQSATQTSIGRIEFPLFDPSSDPSDLKWMKRVYLYVGKHQRLTGEVKKLPKPLVVVGKRPEATSSDQTMADAESYQQGNEELEVLEVVRHKVLFGGRPEPVGE